MDSRCSREILVQHQNKEVLIELPQDDWKMYLNHTEYTKVYWRGILPSSLLPEIVHL
jgi:hypothetical protein